MNAPQRAFERLSRPFRVWRARRQTRNLTIHVIPVPIGDTVEQAWEKLTTGRTPPWWEIEGWNIVTVRGLRTIEDRIVAGELVSVLPETP